MDKIINHILAKKKLWIKAKGSSMLPLLQDKDLVHCQKFSFSKVKIDQIIVFTKAKEIITHRVIYKTPKYLITKGDNNPKSDGRIYPKQIIAKITQFKRRNKIFNLATIYLIQSSVYLQQIIKVKQALDKQGLSYVFLKGLPLHLYYENVHPKRIYADCDVLVNQNDFAKAEQILLKQGYQKAAKSLSPLQQRLKTYEPESVYYKVLNGFMVTFDLHQEAVFMMTELGKLNALYPNKLLQQFTQECLASFRTVTYQSQSFRILNPELLVVYLALHLFHHNFRGAFRYQFLDRVIQTEVKQKRVNWTKAKVITDKYCLANYLYAAFWLLSKYYHALVPRSFIKSLKPTPFVLNRLNLKDIDIFSNQTRVKAGIQRFLYLFWLSPRFIFFRFLVFFNPLVIYTGLWAVYQYFSSLKFFYKRA